MAKPSFFLRSSFDITTGCRLDGRGSIPQQKVFSLLHSFQICSDAHQASYLITPGALSPGVKPPGREADHSPPSSVEVKTGGHILPIPPYVFMEKFFLLPLPATYTLNYFIHALTESPSFSLCNFILKTNSYFESPVNKVCVFIVQRRRKQSTPLGVNCSSVFVVLKQYE
jgi:hypothetical protein